MNTSQAAIPGGPASRELKGCATWGIGAIGVGCMLRPVISAWGSLNASANRTAFPATPRGKLNHDAGQVIVTTLL